MTRPAPSWPVGRPWAGSRWTWSSPVDGSVHALGEGAGAVAGGLDGPEERGPHLVVLELAEGGRGGAARRGDPLPQHDRVLAGVAQQLGRADHGLHDALGGDVAGQPE